MPEMSTVEDLADIVRGHADDGAAVRPVGAGSRRDWGGADPGPVIELPTLGLDRVVEHNAGDFTAILEAGVPLARAQAAFAEAGQWLAIDPPDTGGTVGGLVATADSGPSRHLYGAVRDLVIGITVVLSDGTIARAGGKVIKNVAGYDLAKLFAGSFGTLGLIATVTVRLHPLPRRTATLTATTDEPERLAVAVDRLTGAPLEATAIDAWWRGGTGCVLVRFAGRAADERARTAAGMVNDTVEVSIVDDDQQLWATQRAAQRRPDGAVVRVSGRPTDLTGVIAAARTAGADLVSRAGLGLSYLTLPGPAAQDGVAAIRAALAPRPCAVLDGGARIAQAWPSLAPRLAELTGRLKRQLDPAGVFRPGAFAGGV